MIPYILTSGFIKHHRYDGQILHIPYISIRRHARIFGIKMPWGFTESLTTFRRYDGDHLKAESYRFESQDIMKEGDGFLDREVAETILLDCKSRWEANVAEANGSKVVKITYETWP